MLPSTREIVFHSPISHLSLMDNNTLQVIDNNGALHRIDLETLKVTKSTLLNTSYRPELFDYYIRPFALGKKRTYASFSSQGAEYIIDTQTKINKICHFALNARTQVTKARFSENDTLLITGNDKGRSFIIHTDDGHLIAELPHASDAITAVTIKDEFKLAAYASFSKHICVYRYSSLLSLLNIQLDVVVEMLTFVDDNTLLAITRDGKILKIDIEKERVVEETLLNENLWPSFMSLSSSKKFVYIGTRESMLFCLHVKSLDIVFQIKLPYIGITAFTRTPRYFIFGFKSGEVLFVSHREFEDQYKLNIKLKKMKEASLLFEKNIFLMSHRDTRLVYDEWLVQKDTIINLLSLGHIEEARNMAEPFLFHPKCKLEFSEIELLQPDLMAMHRYFRSMSFGAAYELASSNPLLKKSSIYAQLEALWNKNLQKAQILLSREPILNKEAAKDNLRLFLDVEEKKIIIDQMLRNSSLFMHAENAIRDKKFSLYFKMVSQNTFLEFTPLFKKVLLLGEKLQLQITTHMEEKNYTNALSLITLLHDFTPYRNQALRLKEVCNALHILEHHLENNRLYDAIKVQEQFKLGTNYEPIRHLEECKVAFQMAQIKALKEKQYPKVYAAILPYMSISICRSNVASLMRHFYIAQFEDALEYASAIEWEKSLSAYVKLFGIDTNIKTFAAKVSLEDFLELLTIEPEQNYSNLYPKDLLIIKN